MWQRLCHGKCLGCRSRRGGSQEEGHSRRRTACAEPGGLSRKGRWEGPGHGHGSPARVTEREGHSWWEGSVAETLETDAGSLWGASRSRRPHSRTVPLGRTCPAPDSLAGSPGSRLSWEASWPARGVRRGKVTGGKSRGVGSEAPGRECLGSQRSDSVEDGLGLLVSSSDYRAGDYPGGTTGAPGRREACGAGSWLELGEDLCF